jgi:hypothetical protein
MNELPTLYQNFIHLSRYSRWLDNKKQRETWNKGLKRILNNKGIYICQ